MGSSRHCTHQEVIEGVWRTARYSHDGKRAVARVPQCAVPKPKWAGRAVVASVDESSVGGTIEAHQIPVAVEGPHLVVAVEGRAADTGDVRVAERINACGLAASEDVAHGIVCRSGWPWLNLAGRRH